MSEYLVIFERDGDSWGAYCPDLPGLGVVGDSRVEVEQLVREAIAFHLEALRAAGDPVPPRAAVAAEMIQVAA